MQPPLWQPPIEPSTLEQTVLKRMSHVNYLHHSQQSLKTEHGKPKAFCVYGGIVAVVLDTSFSEQQTAVVPKEEVGIEDACKLPEQRTGPAEEVLEFGKRSLSPSSSGNRSEMQGEVFPELLAEVAQAVGLPEGAHLPRPLRRAIAQFPGRVRGAIAYLQQQQRKRQIENPLGYLYEAIVSEWELSVPQMTLTVSAKQHVPVGFGEWFESARTAGLVLAATMIDGIHHTLHAQLGWMPTRELMQWK